MKYNSNDHEMVVEKAIKIRKIYKLNNFKFILRFK